MQQQSNEMKDKATSSLEQLEGDLEKRPEIILSVLEEDQLVVAKERSHFGRRPLTPAVNILLWALRFYVVVMVVLVAIQVINAVRGSAQ